MRLTRDAGRYVVARQYTDVGVATFNPHLDLNRKHLRFADAGAATPATFTGPFR